MQTREALLEAAIRRALDSLCGDYPSMAADLRAALASAQAAGIDLASGSGADWSTPLTAETRAYLHDKHVGPRTPDDWRKHATEGENTAQAVIERHRRELRTTGGMLAAALERAEAAEAMLRAAPAADLTDDQIDACVGNLGMAPYSVLAGPDEIRKFARKLLAERAFHPQAHTIRTMQATVKFRDRNPHVASAVAAAFPEWDVRCDDIWTGSPADIIVSPANVLGRMDGGIDQVYIDRFGWQLEARLQRDIKTMYNGHLPIGCAHLITTYDNEVPLMICAPTMNWPPGYVGNTENAYQAFRAALRCALTEGVKALGRAPVLLVPGLATATGRMSGDVCAAQLRRAWDEVLVGANAVPPPEQEEPGSERKLSAPALGVHGTFGKGVPERLVVQAAQRHFELEGAQHALAPEQRRQQERDRRALWHMLNGPLDDDAQAAPPF